MDCVTTFEQKSIAITTTTNVTIAVDLKVFSKNVFCGSVTKV